MYAVIQTGGKQFRVEKDAKLKVDPIDADPGSEVKFENVLVVSGDKETKIGDPFIAKAVVTAEVLGSSKDDKVMVFKKRPRKGHKKLRGHRQPYTTVKIKDIIGG
ncbi:MAG: 50S ribosomal protein L21 [Nitrospirota bacterium]|nr:MAG: 50S ribosomal protein L21 [Nitrospirota bacterium]